MGQTYDMVQRLMKELRQYVEAEIAQTQDYLQRVVDKIQNGLQAQDEHLRSSMHDLVDEALQQIIPKVSAAAARSPCTETAANDDWKPRVDELEKGLDGLRRLLLAMRSEVCGMTEQDDDQDDGDSHINGGSDRSHHSRSSNGHPDNTCDHQVSGDDVADTGDVLALPTLRRSSRSNDSEEV